MKFYLTVSKSISNYPGKSSAFSLRSFEIMIKFALYSTLKGNITNFLYLLFFIHLCLKANLSNCFHLNVFILKEKIA